MSTNYENMQAKDFAEHCVNALADIKRAMPKTWDSALDPYRQAIREQARSAAATNTHAVLMLLKNANVTNVNDTVLRMQHFFLMAAYCTML